MYANLHTIIFHFTLIFFKTTCKQTAKKGKTKNSLSLPSENQKLNFSPT